MVGRLWRFLLHEKNRNVIAWLGGGVVVVIGGLWAAIVQFAPPDPSPPPVNINGDNNILGDIGAGAIVGDGTINLGDIGAGASINIHNFSPEQIQALVQASTSRTDDGLEDKSEQLVDLAKQLGVHENAVAGMLQTLGEKRVPLERLPIKLEEIAQRHKGLLQQLQELSSEDPEVERLREEALGRCTVFLDTELGVRNDPQEVFDDEGER